MNSDSGANINREHATLRFTQHETNETKELIQALEEAVYLLNPTEEDMQKKAGVYRVVTALEKLKEKNA